VHVVVAHFFVLVIVRFSEWVAHALPNGAWIVVSVHVDEMYLFLLRACTQVVKNFSLLLLSRPLYVDCAFTPSEEPAS